MLTLSLNLINNIQRKMWTKYLDLLSLVIKFRGEWRCSWWKKMIKKQRWKKEKLPLLLCMIVVGMKLPALIFVAAGFAAIRNENRFVLKRGAPLRVNEKNLCEIVPLFMAYPYYNFSISKLYWEGYSKTQARGTMRKIPPIRIGTESFSRLMALLTSL